MNALEHANDVKQDWEKLAQEPLRVEIIRGNARAIGSELACLRLKHALRVGWAYPVASGLWAYGAENPEFIPSESISSI